MIVLTQSFIVAPYDQAQMTGQRLSLINYDVLRELCDACRKERFHFVPSGSEPATGGCRHCGASSQFADVTDTAVWRLVTHANGDVVIVPMAVEN